MFTATRAGFSDAGNQYARERSEGELSLCVTDGSNLTDATRAARSVRGLFCLSAALEGTVSTALYSITTLYIT
eukprot:12299086-Heterocapsa_arctica.AAC.1